MHFYKGCECCFLVYDITNKESFESLVKWRTEFLGRVGSSDQKNFPFIVLGNKCDIKTDRNVSKEKAQAWARSIGAEFYETSAKDTTCVEEAFMKSITLISNRQMDALKDVQPNNNKDKPTLKLKREDTKEKTSCC